MPEPPQQIAPQSLSRSSAFRDVCTYLDKLAFPISDSVLVKLQQLIDPSSLDSLYLASPSIDLAKLWKRLLTHSGQNLFKSEDDVWIWALATFRELFRHPTPELSAQLRSEYLNLTRTKIEIELRLGGRLYEQGKSSLGRGNILLARLRLAECIACFGRVEELARNLRGPLPDPIKMKFLGMKGVAMLFLARGETAGPNPPVEKLTNAVHNLTLSGTLGNRGGEFYEYLGECYLRLYDATHIWRWLEQLQNCLQGAIAKGVDGRVMRSYAAEVLLRRAFIAANETKWNDAIKDFAAAEVGFSVAYALPDEHSISDSYLSARRAICLVKLYTSYHQLDGSNKEEYLEAAIQHGRQIKGAELPFYNPLPLALDLRANLLNDRHEHRRALNDLLEAVNISSSANPDTIAILNRAKVELAATSVWVGVEESNQRMVRSGCESLIATPSSENLPVAPLAHGVRYLMGLETSESFEAIVPFVLAAAAKIRGALVASSDKPRSFAATHAASLFKVVADRTGEPDLWAQALELYRDVIESGQGQVAAEVYSLASDVARQLAKSLLNRGHEDIALGLLEDARDWATRVLNSLAEWTPSTLEILVPKVLHSKLGEIYLRLHALAAIANYIEKAIFHLSKSLELGNDSPALIGILGDAYLRRGRILDNEKDLCEAVRLKQVAWKKGGHSRENRSSSCAALLRLWRLTSEPSYIPKAVRAASEAIESDPSWPWPYFQLGEIAAVDYAVRLKTVQELGAGCFAGGEILRGDVKALQLRGARAAIESTEFRRDILGGRTQVYVLDDPHRLMSTTVVFKHTKTSGAERELAARHGFVKFLKSTNAPSYFLVPESIGTISLSSDDAVYVMKRAQGLQLGRLAIDFARRRVPSVQLEYERTIDFLAYFHAWRGRDRKIHSVTPRLVEDTVQPLVGYLERTGVSKSLTAELRSKIAALVPTNTIALSKKDAHPENWLITRESSVVILDFESTSFLPVFFEVAQLLDDYPFLPNTAQGWDSRVQLCARYWKQFTVLSGIQSDMTERQMTLSFGTFMLFRALLGLARLKDTDYFKQIGESSTTIDGSHLRRAHWRDIVRFTCESDLRPLNDLAQWIDHNIIDKPCF